MAAQNPFTARYKQFSNAELLEILEGPEDYQPLAVQAAREELDTRQLSQEDLEIANAIIKEKKAGIQLQQEKRNLLQSQARNKIQKLAENLSPIQEKKPGDEKIIKVICVVFGASFLFELLTNFSSVIAMFSNVFSCGVYCLIPALIIFLTPVAIVLFWLKKKNGWILLTFLVSFSLTLLLRNMGSAIYDMIFEPPTFSNMLFPTPGIESFIWPFILNTGILLAITRKSIRAIFKIEKTNLIIAILSGVILFGLLHFNLYTLRLN